LSHVHRATHGGVARLGSGFVIGRDPREAEALARAILSRVRTLQEPAGRAARKRPAER